MPEIRFYDHVEDSLLKGAVIVSKCKGQWVFCKHRERSTYECPGGHRESGEAIEATAKRELWEETGAKAFALTPVCVYSVWNEKDETETFGMLYFADITEFEDLPPLEIEQVELFEELPEHWTYPEMQPKLLEKAMAVYNQNARSEG